MNAGGAFLAFLGVLITVQVVAGRAVQRLNLWGTEVYDPGTALGTINPDGTGTGGLLLPPNSGLQGNPPPLVAPTPGRPVPGDVPGVTGSQPKNLDDFFAGQVG